MPPQGAYRVDPRVWIRGRSSFVPHGSGKRNLERAKNIKIKIDEVRGRPTDTKTDLSRAGEGRNTNAWTEDA
jgi:hypothetical protein